MEHLAAEEEDIFLYTGQPKEQQVLLLHPLIICSKFPLMENGQIKARVRMQPHCDDINWCPDIETQTTFACVSTKELYNKVSDIILHHGIML